MTPVLVSSFIDSAQQQCGYGRFGIARERHYFARMNLDFADELNSCILVR
jgi:hypothetical protein